MLKAGLIKAKTGIGTSEPKPVVIRQLANWPYDRFLQTSETQSLTYNRQNFYVLVLL